MRKTEEKTEERDTFNMVLGTQLKKDFMVKCIDNDTDMSKVLRSFIEDYTYNQ